MEMGRFQDTPHSSEEEHKVEQLKLDDFKTYKCRVIMTTWNQQKNKEICQWNGILSHKYTYINIVNQSLTKEQRQFKAEKIAFSTNGS